MLEIEGMRLAPLGESAQIEALLCTSRLAGVRDRRNRTVRVESRRESLVDPSRPRANRGLLDAILLRYSIEGHQAGPEIARIGPVPRWIPPREQVRQRTPWANDPPLVRFLREHELGLIRHGAAVDVAWCVAQLTKVHPDRTFAIVIRNKIAARKFEDKLRWLDCSAGIHVQNVVGDHVQRVVVGTPAEMADETFDTNVPIEFNKRDIVLFPSAKDALHGVAIDCLLAQSAHFRVFGFLGEEDRLSDYEKDLVAATFGFDELRIPRHGLRVRDTFVRMIQIKGTSGRPTDETDYAAMNRFVWRNTARNAQIADIAKKLAAERSLASLACDSETSERASREDSVIAVVADNVEHLERLHQHLGDWPVHLGECERQSIEPRILASLRDHLRPWALGPRLLMTAAAWEESNISRTGLVIWACGGRRTARVPLCPVGDDAELQIVDFSDRCARIARKWTNTRRAAYIRAGFHVHGESSIPLALREFLRRRGVEHGPRI